MSNSCINVCGIDSTWDNAEDIACIYMLKGYMKVDFTILYNVFESF